MFTADVALPSTFVTVLIAFLVLDATTMFCTKAFISAFFTGILPCAKSLSKSLLFIQDSVSACKPNCLPLTGTLTLTRASMSKYCELSDM